MKEFLVECPKCKHAATVSVNRFWDGRSGKLVCRSCNYTESAENRVRYMAIVKRACDNCGKPCKTVIPNNKEKTRKLTIRCPYCGVVRTYRPGNEEYLLVYKNSGIGDPAFNLPLWFQTEIRTEVFWAYNREHLIEIRNYVAAKLRERQTLMHTTMVERLPNFIKIAKNRALVIKMIDRLLKK